MAIDSRRKRSNVVSVLRFWRPPAVLPDGSLDTADRQQSARGWRAFVEVAVAAAVTTVSFRLDRWRPGLERLRFPHGTG